MDRIALIDGDEVAYKGAFACQTSFYNILRKDDSTYASAKTKIDAMEHVENQVGLDIVKHVVSTDVQLGYSRIDTLLSSILRATSSSSYNLFLSGSENFRNDLATILPYKGNRKEKPVNLGKMKDYLRWKEAETTSFLEADDCLSATQGNIEGKETVICTQDKDLRTVPGLIYNPNTRKLENLSVEEARYNFYFQLLIGDSTDNIPSPHGIGKVTAIKILADCLEKHSSEETYFLTVRDAYVKFLDKGKTKWYTDGMDIDGIIWEIGNLLYMHRTFNKDERWELPYG